jgi:predicted aldo/keto reductase-like oxidoreductase
MKIKKLNLYQEVADNLNKKGVMPFSARQWSMPLVQSVVYGKVNNQQVMDEIKLVMESKKDSADILNDLNRLISKTKNNEISR